MHNTDKNQHEKAHGKPELPQVVEDDKSKSYLVVEYANGMRQQMKREAVDSTQTLSGEPCEYCGSTLFDCECVTSTSNEETWPLGNWRELALSRYNHAEALAEALRDCMADLDHYVSTHGPGPDRRRDAAKAALAKWEAASE